MGERNEIDPNSKVWIQTRRQGKRAEKEFFPGVYSSYSLSNNDGKYFLTLIPISGDDVTIPLAGTKLFTEHLLRFDETEPDNEDPFTNPLNFPINPECSVYNFFQPRAEFGTDFSKHLNLPENIDDLRESREDLELNGIGSYFIRNAGRGRLIDTKNLIYVNWAKNGFVTFCELAEDGGIARSTYNTSRVTSIVRLPAGFVD